MQVFRLKAFVLMLVLSIALQAGTLLNTSAGTLLNTSIVADDYSTGATTKYKFTYTTQTAFTYINETAPWYKNSVLFVDFPSQFSFNYTLGVSGDDYTVPCADIIDSITLNGVAVTCVRARSFIMGSIRVELAEDISANSTLEVTLKNVTNPTTERIYNFDQVVTQNPWGWEIDFWQSPKVKISNSVNTAPIITEGTDTQQQTGEDLNVTFTLNATDADSDILSWSILSFPSNGVATVSSNPDGTSQDITYSPNLNYNGTDSFVVKVDDGQSTDTINVDVNISAINDTPTITSTPITSVVENSIYSYTLLGSDVDGDDLNWSVRSNTQLPSWLELNTYSLQSSYLGSGLTVPYDIAIDNSGKVYITDSFGDKTIDMYDSGSQSSIITGLNMPLGVAVDSNGNVYVSDSMDDVIKKYDGNTVETIITGLSGPNGLSIDKDDNLYICDTGNNVIKKYDGNTVETIITGLNTPRHIAVDNDGNLYITNQGDGEIIKYDGSSTSVVFSGINAPWGIAVDKYNNIYFTDQDNTLKKYNGVETTILKSGLSSPRGIDLDNQGNIYVAETGKTGFLKIELPKTILSGTPTIADIGVHDVNLTLSDGTNLTEHNFQITVKNINHAPTASNISFTIDEDSNLNVSDSNFTSIFNDVDANYGDVLDSIVITTLPSKGTLKLNSNNVALNQQIAVEDIVNLTFTPAVNEFGTPYDSFGFKVNDGRTSSNSANTATINVIAVDDAPTLEAIANKTSIEDGDDLNITLAVNDIEGHPITYIVTSSNPSIATAVVDANGDLIVTYISDANGLVNFEVNATANGKTATQSFDVAISAVNDTPVIASISDITKDEDFDTFNVSIAPSDIDSDNLKLSVDMNDSTIISIPTNSTDWIANANYSGGLALSISPIANKFGTTELNVTVEDPSGEKYSETFSITVTPTDDAPVAFSMAATVGPNSQNTFDTFSPNFSDVDGHNPIMLKIETLPSVGTFETTTDGGSTWTLIDSVPFEVSMMDLANYRFNAGDNSGLNANVNWSIMTSIDNTYASGLYSNTATGVVTIIDPANNIAPDVNITSNGVDINNSIVTINEDSKTEPIYIIFSDDYTPTAFLVGVIDSNDSTKVSLMDGDFNITRISDNNVSVIITPKANVYGDINITLGAFDGDKNGTRSFTLHINTLNDVPTALNFEKVINEDNNYSFATLDPTTVYSDTNDSSQDANELYPNIFTIVTLPSHGMLHLGDNIALGADTNVSITELPTLVYTPSENNNTDVSFTYKAYDGEAWTEVKSATIHVTPVDDAPILSTIQSQLLDEDFNVVSLTLISSDVEGDAISYVATSSNGEIATVTIVNDKVVITPVENANGTVRVDVNATANGQTTTQSFDVAISAVNDDPAIDTVFANLSLLEDSATANYELNVSDIDGDALTVTMTSSDSGILMVSPNWTNPLDQAAWSQTLDYNLTTVADANGEVTITVTVRDENDAAVSKTFTVDVTPVNDAPEFAIAETKIVYKNFVDVNITLLGTDVEEDPLTYTAVIEDDSLASVSFTNNVLIFEAIDGAVGSSDINITLSDGDLNVSNILHFTVLPLEDGEDVEKVGVVDYESDENGTTTTLSIDNNLTISTKEDTNGTVTHEITVAGKVITATSDLNGSEVAFTESGVKTTYSDVNLSLEVNASVTGEASHLLTVTGKTTTATSEKVGASTRIAKDANGSIEIVTSVDVNGTQVSVKAKADGTAEHSVTTPSGRSIATSKVKGAATVIKATGEVQTEVGDNTPDADGYVIRAVVVTNTDGTTHTQFEKVSTTDENDREIVSRTLKESTEFDAGNSVEIDEINSVLYIKTQANLTTDLVIE
ncbi:tandem-95 repeat protein [Candidatus Sulfurimonas baltica]|uniref:Tandem-95 repeat protein n=1 Tax=Candidatus Sulfurimonas baltica TaxID=2740404 RepID=A0A7S7RMJ4_9BACT|nr:tandem-95 repeat protein [Candidatus Sulfurimonas baltica]QOY52287.1 tandem-95 repeat protein [Candidatus Sulfurimonas baltica]